MEKNSYKFNIGVEILRIVAMYMIVVVHILNKGGVLESLKPLTINYEVGWLMEIIVLSAVNCFGLISGYVGVRSTYKYSNIIVLWIKVLFYSLGITLLARFIFNNNISVHEWMMSLFPAMFNHYWYFTSYLGLFVIMPIFNMAINKMSRNQHAISVILLIIVFSICQTLFREDTFKLDFGYSVWWLCILYYIGAFFGKNEPDTKRNLRLFFGGFCGCVLLTWLSKFGIELITFHFTGEVNGGGWLLDYTSPTVLCAGICMLLLFSSIRIESLWLINIIKRISKMTFGVYLIHTQKIVWNKLLADRFVCLSLYSPMRMVFAVASIALIVFGVCCIIEYIRDQCFMIIGLDKKIKCWCEKVGIDKVWV